MLARLKTVHQLTELIEQSLYPEWINDITEFTINGFGENSVSLTEKKMYLSFMFYHFFLSLFFCGFYFYVFLSLIIYSKSHHFF